MAGFARAALCYHRAVLIDDGTRTFIESQPVARLATVDERGRPHAVPVCFALDGDTAFTPVDEKPKRGDPARLRRLRNIAANPRVVLLIDVYDATDWRRLRYTQLHGVARIIEPGAEGHARALTLLRARYPQYRTMALEERPVIAIDVDRTVSWRGDATT